VAARVLRSGCVWLAEVDAADLVESFVDFREGEMPHISSQVDAI
jgi:hypothetical protein